MHQPTALRHEPGLDLLRAAAALLILLTHAVYFVWHLGSDWKMALYAPSLGVEAFYALAGFLLGRAMLTDPAPKAGTLLRGRLLRVLPFYALFLCINLALAGGVAPGDALAHLLLVHTVADPAGPAMPESYVVAAWAWFLLLAAPLLALVARGPRAPQRAAWLALAWIVLGNLLRLGWVLSVDPTWDEGTKKLLLPRIDACAYGLLVAALLRARPAWFAVRGAWLAIGVLLVAMAIALHARADIDHDLAARTLGFTLSGTGIALCLPVLLGWRARGDALSRGTAALARWSMLLYLVHFLPMRLLPPDWPRAADWPAGLLHIAAYAGLCILSAAALHRLLERPWRRWMRLPDRA